MLARLTMAAIVACGLPGCAAPPAPRAAPAVATPARVAPLDMLGGPRGEDFVPGGATRKEIVRIFAQRHPPAQTRLTVRDTNRDSLGQALLVALRERGYAIEEIPPGSRPAAGGLPLHYRFAPIGGESGRYVLSIALGPTLLSRIYARGADGHAIAPDGAWSLRE
ncbi:hypothetical protein GCM10009429_06660 [Dyella marensis]